MALAVTTLGCSSDSECEPGFVLCEGSCQAADTASCGDGGAEAGYDGSPADTFVSRDVSVSDTPPDGPTQGIEGLECPHSYFQHCTSDESCPLRGQHCVTQNTLTLGSLDDPIRNAPEGVDSVEQVHARDGICIEAAPALVGSPDACEAGDSCDRCGVCRAVGELAMCLRPCRANLVDNDICRSGYQCGLGEAACMPTGCSSDDECRIARVDDNGVPGIQTPADCAAFPPNCGADGFNHDSLVYDTSSTASCNLDTFRCDRPTFDPNASAGDTCTSDAECELRGRCLREAGRCTNAAAVHCSADGECSAARTGAADDGECEVAWRGNACTKTGCQVEGNECAGDGLCQTRGVDVPTCLAPCTLGLGSSEDPASWIDETTAAGGCRAGYHCAWNGEGAYGEVNGGCLPTNFSEVSESNLGDLCTSDAECWGPFGQQDCLMFTETMGLCSLTECDAPYFVSGANLCGERNHCVNFSESVKSCLKGCDSAAECTVAGTGCIDTFQLFGIDESLTDGVCFPGCLEDDDCQDGEACIGASATALGRCE